jgi:hypothetical protein
MIKFSAAEMMVITALLSEPDGFARLAQEFGQEEPYVYLRALDMLNEATNRVARLYDVRHQQIAARGKQDG